MKPNANIMQCTTANIDKKRCREPWWANQRLTFSRSVRARGGSPLISPDINIRVRGVHRDRSGLLDHSLLLGGMVAFNQLQRMVCRDQYTFERVEG